MQRTDVRSSTSSRDALDGEGGRVVDHVDEAYLGPVVLGRPKPGVRHARELDVGRDHIRTAREPEAPRELRECLGDAPGEGDSERIAIQESPDRLTGAFVDGRLGVVVEPNRAGRPDLLVEGSGNSLNRQGR